MRQEIDDGLRCAPTPPPKSHHRDTLVLCVHVLRIYCAARIRSDWSQAISSELASFIDRDVAAYFSRARIQITVINGTADKYATAAAAAASGAHMCARALSYN